MEIFENGRFEYFYHIDFVTGKYGTGEYKIDGKKIHFIFDDHISPEYETYYRDSGNVVKPGTNWTWKYSKKGFKPKLKKIKLK